VHFGPFGEAVLIDEVAEGFLIDEVIVLAVDFVRARSARGVRNAEPERTK